MESWIRKWGIPLEALEDLPRHLALEGSVTGASEASVQTQIRLAAAREGWLLWRNNVGAYIDPRGVPVRYGLANDSAKLNAAIKSSDLIGLRPRVIVPSDVGTTIGQFVAIECKAGGWRPGRSKREQAQGRFLALVIARGGLACFSSGELPK